MIIKNDPFCVCTRFRELKFRVLRTSLEERLKTRIHHWRFDKDFLSWFEFRMLCICHSLKDNLFCCGFKMVNFIYLFQIEALWESLKRSWCDQVSSNFFHVSEGSKSIYLISWTDRINDNMGVYVTFDQILNSALNASVCLNPTDKNVTKIILVDRWTL